MLHLLSKFEGYDVEATDGCIGTVSDFLFDDETWKLRWLVVNAGSFLTERRVLIHPSSIILPAAIGQPDYKNKQLPLALTKAQIKGSPDIAFDQPVSRQIEANLYDYYGWDPMWGGASYFGGGDMASPLLSPAYFGHAAVLGTADVTARTEEGDPHLRSAVALAGYHIRASNGEIGHIESFLVDDANWSIRYLTIDTRNWWPGKHVLISPYAVRVIDWSNLQIQIDTNRDQVKDSPSWNPLDDLDQAYERRLHDHYGWPGYRW